MRRALVVAGLLAMNACNKEQAAEPAAAVPDAAAVELADAGVPDAAPSAATAALLQKLKDAESAKAPPAPAVPDEAWFACKKPKDCVLEQDPCKQPVAVGKRAKGNYAKWVKANPPAEPCAPAKKKKGKPKLLCEKQQCRVKP